MRSYHSPEQSEDAGFSGVQVSNAAGDRNLDLCAAPASVQKSREQRTCLNKRNQSAIETPGWPWSSIRVAASSANAKP